MDNWQDAKGGVIVTLERKLMLVDCGQKEYLWEEV